MMTGPVTRILYLHGFASGPSSGKAQFFKQRLETAGAEAEIPELDAGDFENLTISGQLSVIERAAAGQAVSLIGSSMGGYLAALYAASRREVAKLVLCAPPFGFARRWGEALAGERMDEWRRSGSLEVFHYASNRSRRVGYRLVEDGAQYPDYPDFREPALIFHGKHDDVVPARFSEEFAAHHPNARLEMMDSDHQLLNVLAQMGEKVSAFL